MNIEAAILAGGSSKRMGTPKTLIELEGKPLIRWVIDELEAANTFDRIFVVANDTSLLKSIELEVVFDILRDHGPLGGLHAALRFTNADYLFLIACDMPLTKPELIRLVVEEAKGVDVCVPHINGEFEPLFAAYRKNTIKAVEHAIERGERRVISFFSDVRVRRLDEGRLKEVDPELASFFNVNSPEDIDKARERIRKTRESL